MASRARFNWIESMLAGLLERTEDGDSDELNTIAAGSVVSDI